MKYFIIISILIISSCNKKHESLEGNFIITHPKVKLNTIQIQNNSNFSFIVQKKMRSIDFKNGRIVYEKDTILVTEPNKNPENTFCDFLECMNDTIESKHFRNYRIYSWWKKSEKTKFEVNFKYKVIIPKKTLNNSNYPEIFKPFDYYNQIDDSNKICSFYIVLQKDSTYKIEYK